MNLRGNLTLPMQPTAIISGIPNDCIPLIVTTPRICARLGMCSRGLREWAAAAIAWESNSGRMAATVCGAHEYSIVYAAGAGYLFNNNGDKFCTAADWNASEVYGGYTISAGRTVVPLLRELAAAIPPLMFLPAALYTTTEYPAGEGLPVTLDAASEVLMKRVWGTNSRLTCRSFGTVGMGRYALAISGTEISLCCQYDETRIYRGCKGELPNVLVNGATAYAPSVVTDIFAAVVRAHGFVVKELHPVSIFCRRVF